MKLSSAIATKFLLLIASGLLLSSPAWADYVDLTTGGPGGSIRGGIFYWYDASVTGTGVINSFVRINPGGNPNLTFEQGYNTDARPLDFDENSSPQFTHSLRLDYIPWVPGSDVCLNSSCDNYYYEFLLDINQERSSPLLSLVDLKIFIASDSDLIDFDPSANTFGGVSYTPIYEFDSGDYIDLNYMLNNGSGTGDMLAYIPMSSFGSNPIDSTYVYLYSAFGYPRYLPNDGFEEWSVRLYGNGEGHDGGPVTPPDPPDPPDPPSTVPEPGSLILLGSGLAGLGLAARRRLGK